MGQLIKHKADALLKPFLTVALLQAPFRIALFDASPTEYLLGALSGSGNYLPWVYALWFLPHLWAVFFFSRGVVRLTRLDRQPGLIQVLMLSAMLLLGCWLLPAFWNRPATVLGMTFQMQGLPFSADLLCISAFYFLAGFLCRAQLERLTLQPLGILLAGAAFMAAMQLGEPAIGLFGRLYQDPFWATTAALSGIALFCYLAKAISLWQPLARPLAYCGKESLFILIFHSPIQSLCTKGWDHFMGVPNDLIGFGAFVSCIVCSLVLARIIRSQPWIAMGFLPFKSLRKASRTSQPATVVLAKATPPVFQEFPDTEVMISRRAA